MMDILSPSFSNGHKYMGKANVTTATTPAEGIAPPSPRLSMDENTLTMMMEEKLQEDKKIKATLQEPMTKPMIDTSMMVTSPSSTKISKNFPYQSPTVYFAHDPAGYLNIKTYSLIYWENPAQSAGVLCFILGGTWMTRYYSLLYLSSALFTIVASLNWIYVNIHYHSYRVLSGKPADTILHPHSDRFVIEKKRTWFTEDQVEHACNVVMNLFEGLLSQLVDLVLIEDSYRSGRAVMISFLVWTLASMFSIKSMVMIVTLISFIVPRLYLEHQEKVDRWIQVQQEKGQIWLQQHQTQCQTWLEQYHIVGQRILSTSVVCYHRLVQFGFFIYQKQQQWAKQQKLAKASAGKGKATDMTTTTLLDSDADLTRTTN
ncbi:Reticulon-domain-containing protein [Halteromyces radiatus]|uniref:Reticulon-domain-containing protein n=1 Tax=Halteromyces radiatus TaxID=101107 RepID=UPI00221E7CEF|nr:Reticulon-domain-containing protein [Halteromyces radiatus]KAI8086241.1 Reticulon-domain-containing protein [Halteromyces radiatus]